MRLWSSIILTVLALASVAAPARADDPRADIALGYSLIYDHDIKTTFPAGWFVSAAVNATRLFAVAGEVSGHYKSDVTSLRVHTFLAGPRLVGGAGAARFFAQLLAGAAVSSVGSTAISASSSQTNFCYMPAVGLDIGFNPRTAMRLGAGERFIRDNGGTSHQFQFVAGLVFRFES